MCISILHRESLRLINATIMFVEIHYNFIHALLDFGLLAWLETGCNITLICWIWKLITLYVDKYMLYLMKREINCYIKCVNFLVFWFNLRLSTTSIYNLPTKNIAVFWSCWSCSFGFVEVTALYNLFFL